MPVPTNTDALLYVHKGRQQQLDIMADSATLAAGVQRDLALCNAEQRSIFSGDRCRTDVTPCAGELLLHMCIGWLRHERFSRAHIAGA